MALTIPGNPLLPLILQPASADYSKGWNQIANEIKTRLEAIPIVGAVWPFIKWIKGSPDTEEWENAFMATRSDGRSVANAWLINGETSPEVSISDDDSIYFSRQTTVQIQGFLEIEDPYTWDMWHGMLTHITNDLINGDRTFNKSCLTSSIPSSAESMMAPFCGVDCHTITFKFVVEESGIRPITPITPTSPITPTYAATGPESRGYALGNAILSFLEGGYSPTPISTTLSLKRIGWAKRMNNLSTSYPANPFLQCPRLLLRMFTQDLQPGPPQGGKAHEATYKFSLFYFKQQFQGQSHQELLIPQMELISNAFTKFFIRVPQIEAVTGWQSFKSYPEQLVIHDDISHPLKDPNMNISIGEQTYNVVGRIVS